MQNIKLDTGLQTYRINDACEVSFNPTDSGFVKRLYTAFDELKAVARRCSTSSGG